ncbi:MAG: hypothetical protein KQJ78_24395 [Deltaproteobacteria bacterium]|nr:hypothetical protein [Deltaproteobacteria bacterium]
MARRPSVKARLQELEAELKARGVQLSYEKLHFAGLMLKGGLCWFKDGYHIFVDRRKTPAERLDSLEAALEELNRLTAPGSRQPGEP